MPVTKTELDSQLQHLRLDVANLNVLRKLTREQEQRVMGEVFVWWQQARQVEGYLEQCYAEHKIDYNKTQGTVNFRPLLRLVTNNEITATDLDTWSQAFPKILEDVEKSPKHYANNPAEKIAHFVKQKGGKRALSGYYNSRTSVYEPEAGAEIQPSLLFTLDNSEFVPLLKSSSKQYYDEQASTQLLSIPTAKASAEGYSMILVRQDGLQTCLVGSTANTKVIEELLISTYRNDFEALPLTMRVILEPLHIMNVPNSIGYYAEKFIEVSNLKDAWNVGKKELAVKRMIYRAESKDFLISCQQVPSSVVLVAKPKSEIMSHAFGDTFLSNSTRKSIETRLLYQQTFNLFAPSSADKFKNTQPPGISAASVSLHTKLPIDDIDSITAAQIITHTENLKHSPISFIPFYESFGEPRWQVTNKSDDFEATWQASLNLDWLRHASNRFFEQWIKHYGKKANRVAIHFGLQSRPHHHYIEFQNLFKNGLVANQTNLNKCKLPMRHGKMSEKLWRLVNNTDWYQRRVLDIAVLLKLNLATPATQLKNQVNEFEKNLLEEIRTKKLLAAKKKARSKGAAAVRAIK